METFYNIAHQLKRPFAYDILNSHPLYIRNDFDWTNEYCVMVRPEVAESTRPLLRALDRDPPVTSKDK